MISICISGFGFLQFTVAIKLVPLQPYDRKNFIRKSHVFSKTYVFSQPLTANKNSCQPSAAPQNLDPIVNRKRYTSPTLMKI